MVLKGTAASTSCVHRTFLLLAAADAHCPPALRVPQGYVSDSLQCIRTDSIGLPVLGVPLDSNLYYQKALLTRELESIFAHAPRAPQDVTAERLRTLYRVATGQEEASSSSTGTLTQKRLPGKDDSCPVCCEFTSFLPS